MTRVARGLFRLWLVLSVLWIAGVGLETYREWSYGLWHGGSLFMLVFGLLPPVFVLALGSALVWAVRGFR
jgi:hypothetical protein